MDVDKGEKMLIVWLEYQTSGSCSVDLLSAEDNSKFISKNLPSSFESKEEWFLFEVPEQLRKGRKVIFRISGKLYQEQFFVLRHPGMICIDSLYNDVNALGEFAAPVKGHLEAHCTPAWKTSDRKKHIDKLKRKVRLVKIHPENLTNYETVGEEMLVCDLKVKMERPAETKDIRLVNSDDHSLFYPPDDRFSVRVDCKRTTEEKIF
ncbi:hypothetical protein [Endozoicomonas sp. Mp262]|uniref:hypothetical protein n=1 Tax=Endozoicomonas sp. Mp262 TaxID=2919499 RepID=UPI0021D9CCAC